MSFTKRFSNIPLQQIRNEVFLQMIAADAGLSPAVLETDFRTYIRMEDVGEMCIADKYGENLRTMPRWIRDDIIEALWKLYSAYGIQYIDVTPYNFIEKDDRVWVIDFGHASQGKPVLDPYLEKMFSEWRISKWNPRFK